MHSKEVKPRRISPFCGGEEEERVWRVGGREKHMHARTHARTHTEYLAAVLGVALRQANQVLIGLVRGHHGQAAGGNAQGLERVVAPHERSLGAVVHRKLRASRGIREERRCVRCLCSSIGLWARFHGPENV